MPILTFPLEAAAFNLCPGLPCTGPKRNCLIYSCRILKQSDVTCQPVLMCRLANSWAPSDHWETGDFVVGWEHYHPGIDPDPQDPEDLSWFTDQLAIAQAAGSAAEAFFKKHAVGIVTTEHDVLAVSITNWGNFASHIGAYKLDETGTNLSFENDKRIGGMAYALLHTYGDCLTLSIAPRSTLVFAPYKLNPAGTGTTTKTCP